MDEFLENLHASIDKIEKTWKEFGSMDDDTKFMYQLLLFFRNAYKNKRFFESIQRKITIENPDVAKNRIKYYYRECHLSDYRLDSIYEDELKHELLSHFKDICVQYLGYDSLERFQPNGTLIKIPLYGDYEKFDFLANPRVITSSYPNTNERYFNYLVMNWTVHKLPRYYYNEKTGIYEKSDFSLFYQNETEQKLEKEIQSIKKLVPLKERYKYFR